MASGTEQANGVVLGDTNNRILARKTNDYVRSVIINTLCKDMKNDTSLVREDMLTMLKDFELNVKSDLTIYIRVDERSYDASIRMRETVRRFAIKVFDEFDKSERSGTDLKIRLTIDAYSHVMELKAYAKLHGLFN